jgi:hypothetical protein
MIDARKEYQESVKMQLQLKTALGYTSSALDDQAEALSQKLIMDGEEVKSVQIQLANYIKNDEYVRKLTPAVLDLAAATGMDMAQAAKLVGKNIQDDSGELAKFKISIDGAKGSAERVDSVVKGLTASFGDQAEALAKSKDGFDRMAVSWNDFKEKIGGSNVIKMWADGASDLLRMWISGAEGILGNSKRIKATAQADAENATAKSIALAKEEATRLEEIKTENAKKMLEIQKEHNKESYDLSFQLADAQIRNTKEGITQESTLLLLEYNKQQQQYKDNKEALRLIDLIYEQKQIAIIKKDNEEQKKTRLATQKEFQEQEMKNLEDLSQRSLQEWRDRDHEKYLIDQENKKNQVELAKDTVSNLETLAAKHKEFVGLYKTAAIAMTLFDTFKAAQAAFAGFTEAIPGPIGFALGLTAAAVATGAGIARVEAIRSQEFASGTSDARGGMALVGEFGPELVNMPRNSQVYTHNETRNMMGGTTIQLVMPAGTSVDHSAVNRLEKMLPKMLEKMADNNELRTFKSKLQKV